MTDLRKAAEDLLEGVEAAIKAGDWRLDGACDPDSAIQALRQALAQTEQEPVCFLRETSWSYEIAPWDDPNGIPVYTALPKQEYQYEVVAEHADGTYTTRRIPKREWVGLTDEEMSALWVEYHGGNCIADGRIPEYEKAIEAKLKEKNT